MFKLFPLFFNLLGLLLCRLFFPVSVSVSQTAPSTVETGNSFLVQVSISRGNIYGMAKFSEQLPKGFIASAVDNEGAKTSFDKNTIIFSWDSLPLESVINISFRINVTSASVIKADTLTGRFLYINNSLKLEADCSPSFIVIKKGASKDSTVAKIIPVTKLDTVKKGKSNGVYVTRQLSSTSFSVDSGTTVTLTIHKTNFSGFAKIEDSLPAGFKAKAILAAKASFTFVDNMVKFVWQDLPADSVVIVSYRIKEGTKTSGTYSINGDFSYINNHLPAFYNIPKSSFNTITSAVNNNSPAAKVQVVDRPDSSSAKTASIPSSIPAPNTGINYRVQLMALHNPVDVSYFSSQRKITASINTELNGGFTKYTTGSYTDYKLVRDAREDYRNRGFGGPFVVAYNIGVRITVQEALMISHQQWYK